MQNVIKKFQLDLRWTNPLNVECIFKRLPEVYLKLVLLLLKCATMWVINSFYFQSEWMMKIQSCCHKYWKSRESDFLWVWRLRNLNKSSFKNFNNWQVWYHKRFPVHFFGHKKMFHIFFITLAKFKGIISPKATKKKKKTAGGPSRYGSI